MHINLRVKMRSAAGRYRHYQVATHSRQQVDNEGLHVHTLESRCADAHKMESCS